MVFVAVLAVAGCSNGSEGAPYLTQTVASCPAVDVLAGQRSADSLPADFRPISAVRCTFRLAVDQSAASPSTGFIWVAAQRSSGPFEDLVRALHLPPQEQDGEQVCPAAFVLPVLVALTDSSDRTIVPALPGSACRIPLPELQSALDALPWVEIAHPSPPGEVAR
jgi:hypothetical protein